MKASRIALIVILVLSVGCDGNNSNETPSLLPAAAFSLRTDLFASIPAGAGNHFAATVERLRPVSDGFREHLDRAATVSIASERLTPTRTGDDYVWQGTADHRGVSTEFELLATPVSRDITDWFMNVSYEDGSSTLEDFEIVRARTLTNGTLGEWNHYAMIDGVRTMIMRGEYGAVGVDRFVGLTVPDSVNLAIAGDSLEYSEFTNNIRELLLFSRSSEEGFVVHWDEGSNEGWLVATDYREAEQSCWDSSLADTECEQ